MSFRTLRRHTPPTAAETPVHRFKLEQKEDTRLVDPRVPQLIWQDFGIVGWPCWLLRSSARFSVHFRRADVAVGLWLGRLQP